jgi:hypothetical protein
MGLFDQVLGNGEGHRRLTCGMPVAGIAEQSSASQ